MRDLKVIAVSGHAGNGKDTVAGMIREALEAQGESILIAHFADLVKYVCRTFFDWNGEKDDYGRRLLQYVGTDVIRSEEPDFWVNFIIRMMRFFGDMWDVVIIPDARFPNEISRLREAGFEVDHLRIVRKNYESTLTPEQQAHPSETALDDAEPDHVIINDGTLEHLAQLTDLYIKERLNGN